jgi:hypothetical protein
MLNVSKTNPFNTYFFFLQTVEVFAQIQTLVHQSFKLKSSNGEPRPGSSGKSHPLKLIRYYFSSFISDFSSCPFLFLIGSSCRNLDSRRGPISILFPRVRGNHRPFWVHCSWISEDPFQGSFVETPRMARCFQELAPAPNCMLEKLVQEDPRWWQREDKQLGQPSHCSLPGIIFGWNTQKWKSSDCSLSFLVEWCQCLFLAMGQCPPLWPMYIW